MTGALVLLRHGESTANQAGTFTGLLDVLLTARGEEQARQAGRLLAVHHVIPDLILTSTLQRAVHTADLVSDVLGRDIPTTAVWELNERNFGALTGMTKAASLAALGDAEYLRLRRSRDGRPAPMPLRQWLTLRRSPALRGLPRAAVRRTQSFADVITRIRPVLRDRLLPAVAAGRTVLVVAHGNSLRALCACIDDLSDAELAELNLPTGQPLLYRPTGAGSLQPRGGEYLDPAAHHAAALVAAEGGT
ncbi:phosphoglyceromutase [Curtobacterium pusillum]|jgi:2,3-bisphosphoglycerate-dependent phosphoglycerate mutase|uniref:2,3-bisphosphoglycerate-dependent phosphoglycerate mutase n=4 Tax=Curtobacterium pusillum TaxID=69373 RepID=A0AAW3TD13_9MICO|nr:MULTISPECIES: 2,3-bisphosphoglycerate-dependent phosphoglycerate mutase [Curtobacterium]MBA8992072.1 2,3-bisphosphoglycerate-dependent phosphoglycerate mutase [Curtobacterium pusillum]MDT0234381.1 2,3-bisphosphoglycerate-dependent phosphoglycerate mutase [Curtobacterium sp. BRB10]